MTKELENTYYVVESEGEPFKKSGFKTENEFFVSVSKTIAFDDLTDEQVTEIVYLGKKISYVGWQPGMKFEFVDVETGETVWEGFFPEWDH